MRMLLRVLLASMVCQRRILCALGDRIEHVMLRSTPQVLIGSDTFASSQVSGTTSVSVCNGKSQSCHPKVQIVATGENICCSRTSS